MEKDSIQLGTGNRSNQIVRQGIYLGCFWNTFNYQKLTNWKFVVRTQHGKSRMKENTNKMTAGWKVKGRQRILFVSQLHKTKGHASFRGCKQQQGECLHVQILYKYLVQSICFPLTISQPWVCKLMQTYGVCLKFMLQIKNRNTERDYRLFLKLSKCPEKYLLKLLNERSIEQC